VNAREFAERALIGTVIAQPGRIADLDFLQAEDYANPMHQVLHTTVAEMVAEAKAQVEWGWMEVDADDGSGKMPVPTDAEQAYHETMDILDNLEDIARDPSPYAETVEGVAERRTKAEALAQRMVAYPGLADRLTTTKRATLDHALPLANTDAYQVPGVDPMSIFERIHNSGELGTAQIDGPEAINAVTLHTLMATAPPNPQTRTYGLMVLEASMRRQVEQTGMRVGQAVEESSDLTVMLDVVQTALDQVAEVQHRWEGITGTGAGPDRTRIDALLDGADDEKTLDAVTRLDATSLLEVPTAEEVQVAEASLIKAVLTDREALSHLVDRVQPGDFADRATGNTYRTAVEVYRAGEHVDPVTVAWAQQRLVPEHGNGLTPDALSELSQVPGIHDGRYAADVVMRGSLARMTQHAADTVRAAAQHPGLQPGDVLHTTRLAYEAVADAARRMNGRGSDTARLAGLSSGKPLEEALASPAGEPRDPVVPQQPFMRDPRPVER
jgi:replicative DNA helicase